MKKLIINQEFLNSIDEELELSDAYCWEGSSYLSILSSKKEKDHIIVVLNVTGNSIVEHEGDVSGIKNQVNDLKNTVTTIDYFFSKYKITVLKANCFIKEGSQNDDSDYTVYVKGEIKLKIEKG